MASVSGDTIIQPKKNVNRTCLHVKTQCHMVPTTVLHPKDMKILITINKPAAGVVRTELKYLRLMIIGF